MNYQVDFLPQALGDLRRLDKLIAWRILKKIKWLSVNLDNLTPEPLGGDLKGLFKLRVGSHRVLYTISQKEPVIIIHLVGHRREIYKQR